MAVIYLRHTDPNRTSITKSQEVGGAHGDQCKWAKLPRGRAGPVLSTSSRGWQLAHSSHPSSFFRRLGCSGRAGPTCVGFMVIAWAVDMTCKAYLRPGARNAERRLTLPAIVAVDRNAGMPMRGTKWVPETEVATLSANANGVVSSSPGLPRRGYPGKSQRESRQPQGGCGVPLHGSCGVDTEHRPFHNPDGVGDGSPTHPG